MAKLCTNTLLRLVLGTQPPAPLVDSIRVVLDARAVEAGKAIVAEHPPTTGTTPGSDQALAHVHQFLDQLICSRRRESEDQGDILSMLVRAGKVDTENRLGRARDDLRIRDETISMINASLDATTAAMHWALCLVAKHQDAQARLRQELTLAVAQRQETAAERAELPFTEMVVHESLRLYPPNWMLIPRRCQEESNLGGYQIPHEFRVSLPPDQPDVEPVVGIVVSPRSDLRLIVRRLDTAEQRPDS